jgi:hypothetical protein
MVRLKDMLAKKTLQCDYTKEATIVWFHPSFQMHLSNMKDNKRMNTKDITILNTHNEQQNNRRHQKNTNQNFCYGHTHKNKQLSGIINWHKHTLYIDLLLGPSNYLQNDGNIGEFRFMNF